MTPTEKMWTGRLTAFCKLLLLALLLHPGGEGAVTATPNFKVIGNSYARAGGTTSLTCQVVPHQDYPSFKWARNGMIIPYETDKRLSLVNVTKQDAGYYQCGTADSAINGEGRLLHVFEVGDRLPAPDIDPAGQPVCGRTFALKCIFLQNYIPSVDTVYTWYKDDREIKDQCNQTLSFARVDESDAGAYTCTAWEGDKTTTTSPLSSVFYLTPLVSPKVTINKVPLGARVKGILGGNFSLNCEVTEAFPSVPVNGYTWSVSRSSETQNRSLEEHGRSLYLGPLTTDHRGRYFCEARTNKIFRNLTLAGHASVTVDVVYLDKLKLTSDQKVNKGNHVTLTCAVDSHPTARLAWIMNGQEVRHVTDNVDHYFIRSAACSDSNNYTCAASNPDLPGLKINATVQLTVLCKQATAKFQPTESLPTTAIVSETGKTDVESVDKGLMAAAICFGLLLLVVILAAVVGFVCWRRRNDKSAAKASSPETGEPKNKMITSESIGSDKINVDDERRDERKPLLKENSDDFQSVQSQPESKMAPPPQGPKIRFGDVYRKGAVHVLPPLTDSKTIVIERLISELSKTLLPEDFSVFLFTQSLPCQVHAIIYHRVYGVIIVEIFALKTATRSELKQAAKDLKAVRDTLRNDLKGQLRYEGVTMLLALPEVKAKEDLNEKDREMLQKKDIQILLGTTETESKTWLQTLFPSPPKEQWGLDGNSDQAFEAAVSKYLTMASFLDGDDPPTWLVTPDQAAVLQRTDKVVHVWGPPGSGKSLLLLDRVERWLLRGKAVVLAVCDPSYKLLLHRLGRIAVNGVSNDMAAKVTLCTDLHLLKETIESLGKDKSTSSICVAVDAIDVLLLPTLLEACRSSTVESTWTTSRADLPSSEEFRNLGVCSVPLQYSLRCPGPVLQLAVRLLPAGDNTAPCKKFPHASASQTSALVEINRHADQHLPAFPVNFDCKKCDEWLKALLHPQETSPPLDPEQWKRWVVLLTGDWGSDSQLTEKLVEWLRRQGIPAVHEWQPDRHASNLSVASLRSSDRGSSDKEDRASTLARMETSEDKAGCPAVHVMQGSLFTGLEKPCVLVVHYDWRDYHPDHQSEKFQYDREQQHRYQLYRAITCCRTTPAVLLLSPSPVASLL